MSVNAIYRLQLRQLKGISLQHTNLELPTLLFSAALKPTPEIDAYQSTRCQTGLKWAFLELQKLFLNVYSTFAGTEYPP